LRSSRITDYIFIVAQILFCCLSMFPTCGFNFYEAQIKTRIRIQFYLDGAQKARRSLNVTG